METNVSPKKKKSLDSITTNTVCVYKIIVYCVYDEYFPLRFDQWKTKRLTKTISYLTSHYFSVILMTFQEE